MFFPLVMLAHPQAYIPTSFPVRPPPPPPSWQSARGLNPDGLCPSKAQFDSFCFPFPIKAVPDGADSKPSNKAEDHHYDTIMTAARQSGQARLPPDVLAQSS